MVADALNFSELPVEFCWKFSAVLQLSASDGRNNENLLFVLLVVISDLIYESDFLEWKTGPHRDTMKELFDLNTSRETAK